jgi:hypothetical protein
MKTERDYAKAQSVMPHGVGQTRISRPKIFQVGNSTRPRARNSMGNKLR